MSMRGVLAHKAARFVLTGTVVGAGIVAGLLGPHPASAEIAGNSGVGIRPFEIDLCQSDPIITMTQADGSIKQLTVDVAILTSSQHVSDVYYNVHIPTSVRSWSVAYPPGDIPQSHEHVAITADAPNGRYVSTISVTSAVRAPMIGSAWTDNGVVSRSGNTNQTLRLRLNAR